MLKWFLSLLQRQPATPVKAILVDREGVAYLPTKRVVLRASR